MEKNIKEKRLDWKVNTPAFLKEIFDNYPGHANCLKAPANIFKDLLTTVAIRASELNDPVLNALMCRLALYGCADPYDKENYDQLLTDSVLKNKEYTKWINDKRKSS